MKFKRVLAGLLVGAMVVTSAPVSGLGALAVLAAETEAEETKLAVSNVTVPSSTLVTTWGDGGGKEAVTDGDQDTIWHSLCRSEEDGSNGYRPGYEEDESDSKLKNLSSNNEIVFELSEISTVSRMVYYPKDPYKNGDITKYEIYAAGEDGVYGSEPVSSGTWGTDLTVKEAALTDAVNVKFIKLVVKQAVSEEDCGYIAAREIELYGTPGVVTPPVEEVYEALTGLTGSADSVELTGESSGAQGQIVQAVDGDLSTYWHTNWGTETEDNPKVTYETDEEGNPVKLTGNNNYYIALKNKATVSAVNYTPRNHYDNSGNISNGAITECNVYVSTDNGATWIKAAEISGDSAWSYAKEGEEGSEDNFATKTITFEQVYKDVTNVRIEAIKTAGVQYNRFINAAEFGVMGKEDAEQPPVDTREVLAVPSLKAAVPAEGAAAADTAVDGYEEGRFEDAADAPAALTTTDVVVEKDGDYDAFSGKVLADVSQPANDKFNITGNTPFLISFDMKADELPDGNCALIGKLDNQYGLQIHKTNGLAIFCNDNANTANKWPQSQIAIPENFWGAWHKVVAMYDGNKFSLYLDGVLAGDDRANSNITIGEFTTTSFTLGYNSTKADSDPAYPGKLANVVMYKGDQVPTDAADYDSLLAALAEKTPMFALDAKAAVGEAPNYTVETAWTNADGEEVDTFARGSVYTMTATLTAKDGYKFAADSVPASVKTDNGDAAAEAVISDDGSVMTLTCSFDNLAESVDEAKALLGAEIEAVKALTEADYTADTWEAVKTALEEAEAAYKDENVTAAELKEKTAALTAAKEALVTKAAAAAAALAEAKAAAEKVLAEEKYTAESYAVYKTAKEAVDALTEESGVEDIQKAADDLLAAIKGLKRTSVEISAPVVSYTAPAAGDYALPASVAVIEEDAHYDAVADRTDAPASLKKNGNAETVIGYADGNWGFAGQWIAANNGENNEKFNIYGDTPMVLTFKVKIAENEDNVQLLGKMDEQYGLQLEGASNRVILYCCDAKNAWPEVVYDFDESFWDTWHEIMLVYSGTNMQLYVDGEAGHPSSNRANADPSYNVVFGQYASSEFTIGYNISKATDGSQTSGDGVRFMPFNNGLMTDIRLYSGTDYSAGLTKGYAAIMNQLETAEPAANITLRPYDVKTTWAAGDSALAADAKFAGETVYTATTVFTAHEGYSFAESSKPSVDGTVEVSGDGTTMTVTKTFPATEKLTCTCALGEITGVSDQTIALGVADSKNVTLKPSAAVTGDCKVDGHPQNVSYSYEITGVGTTGATVTDAGVVTVTGEGNATVKITATLAKEGGEVVTAEKSIVLTVTSNKATAEAKNELKSVIDDAKSLDENVYTEATYQVLADAITRAETVFNKANASKTEVANAKKAVEDAKAALKTKEQELKEQIAAAKDDLYELCNGIAALDKEQYTAASYNAMVAVYDKASSIYNNESATLDDVNNVIAELQAAKDALVTKADAELAEVKSEIDKAVASADAVIAAGKKDYTDAQWNTFTAAYNAVKNAPSDADAATLRGLLKALTDAQSALKSAVVPLAAPTVKSAKASASKSGVTIKVTVNAVAGADRYDVYRVVKGKASKVGTTASGKTAITDKKVTSRTVSYYAVAVSKDGTQVSANGAAKKVTLAKAVSIKKISSASKSVKLTWKKVKGAKVVVYRSSKRNSGYVKVGTSKKNATVFTTKKGLKKGKSYYYKIVVVKGSKISLMSKAKKVKVK